MKTLAFFLLLSFSCHLLPGQKIAIGAEGGIITSSWIGTKIGYEFTTYFTGVSVDYRLSNSFSLSTGLNYLRQGHRSSVLYPVADTRRDKLVSIKEYLSIPLNFNAYLGERKKWIATIGLYAAKNIKAYQELPPVDKDAVAIPQSELGYIEDISRFMEEYYLGGTIAFGRTLLDINNIRLDILLRQYQSLTRYKKNCSECNLQSTSLTLNLSYKL